MRPWQKSPGARNEFAIEGDVVWIRLTQGQETCVDLEDWDKARIFRWYASWCPRANTFYARTNLKTDSGQKTLRLHQFILASGKDIDHINKDGHLFNHGLDNRRQNLRESSRTENCQSRRKLAKGSSKFKGVTFLRGKWQSNIRIRGDLKYLGLFEDEVSAALAYDRAAKEAFGEFARPNGVST